MRCTLWVINIHMQIWRNLPYQTSVNPASDFSLAWLTQTFTLKHWLVRAQWVLNSISFLTSCGVHKSCLWTKKNPETPHYIKHRTKKSVFWNIYFKVQTLIYLDFWLCACALSTLTTIFCSSIRKARFILKETQNMLISYTMCTK